MSPNVDSPSPNKSIRLSISLPEPSSSNIKSNSVLNPKVVLAKPVNSLPTSTVLEAGPNNNLSPAIIKLPANFVSPPESTTITGSTTLEVLEALLELI